MDIYGSGADGWRHPASYRTSTRQVLAALNSASGPLSRNNLQETTGLYDREHFVREHFKPLLAAGLIKMTLPDKPTSSKQKYRLTVKGKKLLERLSPKDSKK
ncbi:MAG: hypothetical protein WA096_01765 [Smithella sp.]